LAAKKVVDAMSMKVSKPQFICVLRDVLRLEPAVGAVA
jgi:hypothetical protein